MCSFMSIIIMIFIGLVIRVYYYIIMLYGIHNIVYTIVYIVLCMFY